MVVGEGGGGVGLPFVLSHSSNSSSSYMFLVVEESLDLLAPALRDIIND